MDSSASGSDSEAPATIERGAGHQGKQSRRAATISDDESDVGNVSRSGLGAAARAPVLGGGTRKRRQTADSLFGVFAEGDEPRNRAAHKSNRAAKPPKTAINFVHGETMNKQEAPKSKADGGASSDDEADIDPRFRFDATDKATVPAEMGPQLLARNKLSFGQMSSNYGIGFKMMLKMGFQGGGLGLREDGIANPIEVLRRKDRQGLQEDGEMIGQDLYGRDALGERRSVEELLSAKTPKGQQGGQTSSESWRRDARTKKPRTVYKTAAEVASEPSRVRIVDMRGPEVRVATSFAELAANIGGDSVRSLAELRHNARLLVARYEGKVRAAVESRRHCEDVLLSVAQEKERLEASGTLGQRDVLLCRRLVRKVEDLQQQHELGSVNLKSLASAFGRLCTEHPKEFKAMRVLDVAVALALPTAKRELADWRPLQRPDQGLALMDSWRELLGTENASVFALLCDNALLPPLRTALCEWSARDCEPCLRLFECCRKRLPPGTVDAITVQILLPRLSAEVDAWDPRKDKVPVQLWIHPWLPVLGERLDCLWAPLRFKLSKCLDNWDTGDRSALEVLGPWKLVLDPGNWEPLIEKILVKLERAMADVQVRPDGQDVTTIKDLLVWAGIAPATGLARVMDVCFFPKWHSALGEWLRAPSCDYGEVLQWYQSWKAMMPEELREEPTIQRHFANGLQVMRHFMAQGNSAEPLKPAVPPPTTALPRGPGAGRPQRSTATPAAVAAATEEVSLSLADYLAEVAGEQGVVFRPKANVLHAGNQVYQLGSINVYLSRNLVYATTKGGSEWSLVSLDEAMGLARHQRDTEC